MSELSPAAEAVLDAALPHMVHRYSVAAALRAAADQVVPEIVHSDAEEWLEHPTWMQVELKVRCRLLAIANELESQ